MDKGLLPPSLSLLEFLPVFFIKSLHHSSLKLLYPGFDTTFEKEDFDCAPAAEFPNVVDIIFHPTCTAWPSALTLSYDDQL
jgi:hypothetical protein